MKILCDVQLFLKEQNVYLYSEGGVKEIAKIPLESLGETLPILCYNQGVYNLVLSGNKQYVNDLVKEIYTNEMATYAENKIIVEV